MNVALILIAIWVTLTVISSIAYYQDIQNKNEKSRWQYWLIIIFWPLAFAIAFIVFLCRVLIMFFTGK